MSLFITFEGGEGCGKSVQSRMLSRHLCREGYNAVLTREPGGTPLGEKICRCLKWYEEDEISAITELFLFNASRRHLVETIINPSIKQGQIVVCDRFTDSTFAYQGYGRGLDLEVIGQLNQLATGGIKPDLTILLDMPSIEGLTRKKNLIADRFEKEAVIFHEKVRQGYLQMAKREPQRWFIIDAKLSKWEITHIIRDKVSQLLAHQRI
jgi:dTMP kinase